MTRAVHSSRCPTRRRAFASTFAALTLLAAPHALAQAAPKKPAPSYVAQAPLWEHERSDLKPDPRFHFGKFANGLRYAWADHANPPRQLHLRLFVDIGSLAEQGDEVGIAHFLEHMAFNGSKSFKAGTLVPTFQSQGIRFGSDVNAHTGFDETVYELDLPDGDPARLEQALRWFRDIVDGLKLDPKEIEAEKGVVDAEEETRRSKGQELMLDRLAHLLDGSRYPRRLPIGEKAVRAQFDKKRVTAFYDRWYRPERCTFLIVGDLGGQDPSARLEAAFASAKGRGKAAEPPGGGLDGLTFAKSLFTDPSGGGLTLYVAKGHAPDDLGDDARTRLATLELAIACDVLEERMNQIVPRTYVTASVASGARFHPAADLVGQPVMEGISLRLSTNLNHWAGAMQMAEREVRRFLERGAADGEWQEARERLADELKEPTASPNPTSAALIEQLLEACRGRAVPMDAAAERAAWRTAAAALDPARAFAAFIAEWKRGQLVLAALGDLDLRDSAREMLEDAWKTSAASNLDVKPIVRDDLSALAPKKEKKPAAGTTTAGVAPPAAAPFAYALPDTPAAPSATVELPALRARRIEFRNGVRAFVRQLEGGNGRFHVEASLGHGLLRLESEACDVAKVAERVLPDAALKKLKRAELEAALATAGGDLDFSVGGDRCVFNGRAQGGGGEAGLRCVLEALVATLTDGGDRAAAFAKFQKELPALIVDTDRPTWGSARLLFDRALANGDRRRLPLERETATRVTLDAVSEFLDAELAGPIDVVIVAELPLDALVKQLASTLGTLPPRAPATPLVESRRAAPPMKSGLDDPRGAIDLDTQVALLHVVYGATDAISAAAERRIELLADIVNDRLRSEIREKLGTTYSPNGSAWGDPAFTGRGRVELDLRVDPAKVPVTKEACLVAMETLARSGASQGELDRLRAARLGTLDAMARDPAFWVHQLHRCFATPALQTELADLKQWYGSVTLAEINALAKQSLTREKASVLAVRPR